MNYFIYIIICLICAVNCLAQRNTYAESQVLLLYNQLSYYQSIQEKSWSYFSCDEDLQEGDKGTVIPLLRRNLILTGDLQIPVEMPFDSTLLDEDLEQALKQYQRRHNLLDDGILGARTIKSMNIPLQDRRKQIKSAIAKWQQFSHVPEPTYILVNLPDFSLSIIDSGINIQRMKVCIGKRTHPTPAFYSELSYLVIHPTWIIPQPIAMHEILPLIKADKKYLDQNQIEVITYKKNKLIKVMTDTIQWEKISKENFRYELQQLPGPKNALGAIKFMFPNEYNIYIHDTPEKHLFNYNKRTFTHGCIRLENPADLAAWLLNKSNDEVAELLENSLDDTIFPLNQSTCTFIDHFNAWVDHEGFLQFREQVYPPQQQ